MNSSPVLCQQSQNKILSELQRMKNEHNMKQAEPNLSKVMSSLHLSNKDGENKDPAISGPKPPLQPGGSRLPVLAKSLKLQTPCEFKQSHNKWEEKQLACKAKKKKPCTRPLPFNFSQPKTTKRAIENCEPLRAPQSRTHANQLEHSACKTIPNKYQDVLKSSRDTVKGLGKSHGKAAVNTAHLSGQPSAKLKAPLKNPLSTSDNKVNQNVSISSAEAHLHPEVMLGGKEPTKTSLADETASPTTQTSSKPLNEKSGNFQPDHAALLSVLRNDCIGHASQTIVTPKHSKQYNYLPQRVSVKKSQQKDGPIAGPVRLVQFSPDVAALRSILQNEGVKAVGATSRTSVCPPGRGTSIYTAQRVPVKKSCPDSTSRPVAALKETAQTKWTPQRVRNIKHQPMSAMKWHQSPYGTLGHGNCKSNIHPRQEQEVVQRLFDDPEDDESPAVTDDNPSMKTEQIPVPASSNKLPCDEKAEMQRCNSDDEEEELKTFLQAPPRESVIFFSTGKKLIRDPQFENQEGSAQQEQHDPVSSEQRKFATAHSDLSEPAHQINSTIQRLHKDFITQKPCFLNPAVAMLRKRFPPLEELRLDEEVATYTSASFPATSGFVPPRPRCGNPLASVLHFEESTRFVPIDFDLSSGPTSVFSSSLHER